MQVWHVSFPEQQAYVDDASALAVQLAGTRYTPEPSLFLTLFPFHLLIDQNMRLVQVCMYGGKGGEGEVPGTPPSRHCSSPSSPTGDLVKVPPLPPPPL